jgi:hypothetical protein
MAKRRRISRSKSSGKAVSKAPKLDLAKIKRAVAALEKQRPPVVADAGQVVGAQLSDKRRALAKKLEPLLAKGLDLKKATALLAKYNRERKQILKRKHPAIARMFAAAGQRRRSGIATRRQALDVLATMRPHLTPTIISLSPFLIKTVPTNALWASSMAPGNAWAQMFRHYERAPEYPEEAKFETHLYFYYLWHNLSDDYAGVDVHCAPWFTGACHAVANTGILFGGFASLYGVATLTPIYWNQPNPDGIQPHTYPFAKAGQAQLIVNLEASGGGFWSMETGDSDSMYFDNGVDLRYRSLVIPPRRMMVFQVDFRFTHDSRMNDGYVTIDFARAPNYSIAIPSLDIALFTGASVDAGPFGTIGASLD